MKIAIYCGSFKKDQDGSSKTLYELKESLLKNKFEVRIWSPSITPQVKNGLTLFKIPSIPFPLYPDYRLAFFVRRIRKQLIEFKPNLIQIAVPDFVGLYFLKFATKRNVPVVISHHTDFPSYLEYYHLNFLSKKVWEFLVWFYNKSDLVYVPTREVARVLQSRGIKKVKIWSRGINREMYNPKYRSLDLRMKWNAQNKKVILYSGRFVWYKDLDVFSKVYELFKERGPGDVTFVLVGDGPIKDKLEKRMPDAYFP